MRLRCLGLAFALLSSWVCAAPAEAPDAYAARWPLQLPAGASLVRLTLPAEVLTQLQTADLRDVRVFNGTGQSVPLALDRSRPETTVPTPPPIALPTLPILADAQTHSGTGAGLSMRVEDGPNGRVVHLHAPASPTAAASAAPAAAPTLIGALVDTREQKAALQTIELDADWPAARPFTFRLHTSTDLQHWQPMGEVTVFRAADGTVTAPAHVALRGAALHQRYLRVTWDSAAAGAVQVRGVRLLPQPLQAAPARVAVPLALPEGARHDSRAIEWRLPFATPLVALDIRTGDAAALVPVRVLARQQREQPWTPLARHVVFSLPQDSSTQRSPAIELGQAAWREWRVEADAASPGFATPPQLTAWLAPVQVVFVASGAPPFTLAAGRADAPATGLPLGSLIPGYQPGAQNKLPQASLPSLNASAPIAALPTTAPAAQRDVRRWTLWAILLAGVLLLGGMAWALMRQLGKPPSNAENHE